MKLSKRIQTLKDTGTYRTIPALQVEGKWVISKGKRYLNLSGNDYLGLLDDASFVHGFVVGSLEQRYAFSSCSSRLLTGNSPELDQFEQYLSHWYGAESALCFDSGYHANIGLLPALCKDIKCLILADKFIHASIIDGIRLSGADFRRFKHNNVEDLEIQLHKYANDYEEIWIVVESIYSMDGDYTPLQAIVSQKKQFPNIHLYVDEAHAVACCEEEGRGYAMSLKLAQEIDVLLCPMGKGFASLGAYAILSQELRTYLVSTVRSLIYTTALPPQQISWSHYVARSMPALNAKRRQLQRLVKLFSRLSGITAQSHIIPMYCGSDEKAVFLSQILQDNGFYALPIRRPTVPPGGERVRLSLSAAMTEKEIQSLATIIRTALKQQN